jgi:hypothetical protein
MENSPFIFSIFINALLGIAMFFMKATHDNTKETITLLRADLELLKSTTIKKEDFKEFKEELWRRLDNMEESMRVKNG